MFRRLLPVLAALPLFACALPLPARDLVHLDVVDRDLGRPLPEYRHRGQDWVAGVPGHRYAVRLSNTTGERVLVVLSVDGVNAVSGETAAPSQAGYVLEPWETADIGGWRKSLNDVAQFVFTDLRSSYAARTGRPDNIGVVGIAVFRERRPRPLPAVPAPPVAAMGQARRESAGTAAASADRARAAEREEAPQRLGTGHGQREWAPVGQTRFMRASTAPEQVAELRYDSHGALVAMGVLPRHARPGAGSPPHAFPGSFVADPPGWR